MNDLELLHAYVKERHPGLKTEVFPPFRPDGFWSLDVDTAKSGVVIEWRHETGFLVSTARGTAIFEGADEMHPNLQAVKDRVTYLLVTGEETVPQGGAEA